MVVIREAVTFEATDLTSLAMRSKAFWGYSSEFMSKCKTELLILDSDIASNSNYYAIAEGTNNTKGFYAIKNITDVNIVLESLFVEPKHIGSGIGRILFEHAKNQATLNNANTLIFQADPNAKNFYLAMGATLTGRQESSSFPGRYLPTFSILLNS